MKIHLEVSLDEVLLLAKAVDNYDRVLGFNEQALHATPEEKLAASADRNLIRQMRYLREAEADARA